MKNNIIKCLIAGTVAMIAMVSVVGCSKENVLEEATIQVATASTEKLAPEKIEVNLVTEEDKVSSFIKKMNNFDEYNLLKEVVCSYEDGYYFFKLENCQNKKYIIYSPAKVLVKETGENVAATEGIVFCEQGRNEVTLLIEESEAYESVLIPLKEGDYVAFGDRSISSCYNSTKEGDNIYVLPGVYEENVHAFDHGVNIIGLDKNKCILQSSYSDYYTPPIEIGCGKIENMTIKAVDKGSNSSTLKAYGIHVESHSLYNKSLILRNCSIYSDFNTAVGMGLRGGCEVIFDNCSLIGYGGGIFCHDSPYSNYTGVQNISFYDCYIEGLNSDTAVWFDSQGIEGATVNVLFVNNVVKGEILARNNGGNGNSENFEGLKNFYISPESSGNNLEQLNIN